MKYFRHENGVVTLIIECAPETIFEPNFAAPFISTDNEQVKEGWLYVDGVLSEPPPKPEPVPATVTMRQARLALLDLELLSSIDEAINTMPEPDKTKAKIEWEYAAVVERNSDWVSDLGQQLGLSDAQIDDLFRLAATK